MLPFLRVQPPKSPEGGLALSSLLFFYHEDPKITK